MIVMKFGGSSVKDAEMFKKVADIVESRLDQKPIVVLSAVKGTTDGLISSLDEASQKKFDSYDNIVKNHNKILTDLELDVNSLEQEFYALKQALEVISMSGEKTGKLLDYVCFFGERMSVKILAALLNKQEIKAKSHVSGDVGLITDSNFGDASILEDSFEKMNEYFVSMDYVPVVTGFGGKDINGEFTTFQRGGSDYVAALIGAAVDAEEIQIWTDVNGVMTANPKIVENAKSIKQLSFDEASELAYFGAKVLHPKTILPAVEKEIPVIVLNTYEAEHPGTRIVSKTDDEKAIKAISYKKDITIIDANSTRMINAYGFLAKIFEVFNKHKTPIDMISTSEVDVSMTIDDNKNVASVIDELQYCAKIVKHDKKAIIYVVGNKMKHNACFAGKILTAVGNQKIKVDMISQCFDGVSFGFVVDEQNAEEVVSLLHKELIE